ncbi:hypothetical protein ANCDUO_05994 [Ancylostoma duodenale]|uniref:Uncharacterized protein n=1 Tax=Ancylostoma duodenale TaxID=51022 RepID=A0A0C2GQX9_9BILA|nr:hypothetical protein ANCDUO_05994 [Ancylostoma duodenale]
MLHASCLFGEEDAELVSNDGPTTQQRIAATYSALEDVMATRTTSLTRVAAERHAGEDTWIAQLKLKPFTRQWDRTSENEVAKE